jgi:hypothetical protein
MTEANNPPVLGSPTPSNESMNNPLGFSWSIPISDSEGDSFDWTIQCSNSQTSGAPDASNGTKTLNLSSLAFNTIYKVWVNATDPDGSGLYTRRWYEFTTITNQPPNIPSNPNPSNGATNVNISSVLSWTGGDPDSGDTVTYDVYFGTSTAPSIVSHNQSATTYDPGMLAYQTTYYWQIVAWDDHGALTAGAIWNFTTEIEQDVTPPDVRITVPLQGYIYINWNDLFFLRIPFIMTFVIGKITVVAEATDNQSGISKVEFSTNMVLRHTDDQAPYNWTWSEKGLFQYSLQAVAYDKAGNSAASNIVTLWKLQWR